MYSELFDPQNYFFNPYALPTFSTAAALFFVLLQILILPMQVGVRIPFILALLTTIIWLVAFSLMYCSKYDQVALVWAKLGYFGVPFIFPAIYDVTVRFRGIYGSQKLLVWTSWIISSIFAALAFDTLLIRSVREYWWGFYPQYGVVGVVFIGYFVVMAGATLLHYYLEYERTQLSPRHREIKSISFGILVAYLGAVDFIPKLGISVYPFGYFGVFISAFLLTEAFSSKARGQAVIPGEKVTERQAGLHRYAIRLHKQQLAILSSLQIVLKCQSIVETVKQVIEEAAAALEVERVAVWKYDPALSTMQCMDMYRRSSHYHSVIVGQVIHPASSYLEPLLQGQILIADNLATDPRMVSFQGFYLDSSAIVAIFDVPVRRDGQLLGVVSYQLIGKRRHWHEDEKEFAQLLAEVVVFITRVESESLRTTLEMKYGELHNVLSQLICRDLKMMEIEKDLIKAKLS